MSFQGNYISYNMENMNHTRPIATVKLVLGFKTAVLNVGLAQLTGKFKIRDLLTNEKCCIETNATVIKFFQIGSL